jgi:hypothetical protein
MISQWQNTRAPSQRFGPQRPNFEKRKPNPSCGCGVRRGKWERVEEVNKTGDDLRRKG